MEEYVFICEDSIDGILTGIYHAYEYKKEEGIETHECLHLSVTNPDTRRLFTTYLEVETDREKAQKVIRTLIREFGEDTYYDLCLAMVSNAEDKADAVYHTVVTGLQNHDRNVMLRLQEDAVHRTFSYQRFASRELNHWREFLRFEELENGILYAKIGPKSNILAFLMPHFADRLPADNFVVYDEKRGIFGLHPQYKQWYMVSGKDFDEHSLQFSQKEAVYRELFTRFCERIAIESRENPALQKNMLPLWFRNYMVEFDKKYQ